MKIDRALRDVEDMGDFAGGLALTGPAQHLHLPARQLYGDLRQEFGRYDADHAKMDGLDQPQDMAGLCLLLDHLCCPASNSR